MLSANALMLLCIPAQFALLPNGKAVSYYCRFTVHGILKTTISKH
jgi:hypothetical protein